MAGIIIAVLAFILLILFNNIPLGYREEDDSLPEARHDHFDPRVRLLRLTSEGNTKAIICIHGFPSTPHTFAWCAEIFHAQGYDVYAPLLPGFPTSPVDLVGTHFSHWLKFLRICFLVARSKYQKVFLLGASLGGSLALSLSADLSDASLAPDGICTIGTSVFMNRLRKGILKHPGLYISRTIGWFTRAINPGITTGGDAEASVDGELRWIGYRGLATRMGAYG